jgi:hypothetical protein
LATKHDVKELALEIKTLESKFESEFKLVKWGLALVIAVTVLPALKQLLS